MNGKIYYLNIAMNIIKHQRKLNIKIKILVCGYKIKKRKYVGLTQNPHKRFNDHFNGKGAKWTKRYPPIKVIKIISDCDNFDEDKYTIMYMSEYGINNVRGGSFCQVCLSNDSIKTISRMIKGSTDKCFMCGKQWYNAYKKWTREMENELVRLLKSGMNFKSVGEDMGRSRGAIKIRLWEILENNNEHDYNKIIRDYNITACDQMTIRQYVNGKTKTRYRRTRKKSKEEKFSIMEIIITLCIIISVVCCIFIGED